MQASSQSRNFVGKECYATFPALDKDAFPLHRDWLVALLAAVLIGSMSL